MTKFSPNIENWHEQHADNLSAKAVFIVSIVFTVVFKGFKVFKYTRSKFFAVAVHNRQTAVHTLSKRQ